MNIQKTMDGPNQISQEKLLAAVGAVANRTQGRDDDDHPLPPGPWDPVIRAALERVISFGPLPDPWGPSSEFLKLILTLIVSLRPELSDALKPHSRIDLAALNPPAAATTARLPDSARPNRSGARGAHTGHCRRPQPGRTAKHYHRRVCRPFRRGDLRQ